MNGDVNPQMLTLARETRGMTQRELAEAAGISQGKVSKYEAGILNVSVEDLEVISTVLRYPQNFFFLTERRYGVGSSAAHFRKRRTVPIKTTKIIEALSDRLRIYVKRLLDGAHLEHAYSFPQFDVDEFDGDVEYIAYLVRQAWKLPPGPIKNLISVIEDAGGVVYRCDFGTPHIDGISHWVDASPPLFLLNQEKPGERERYTLAHEIGHVVMHGLITKPVEILEEEADRFAAAFLMPRQDILPELRPVTLAHLAQLKLYWKVSIQALIVRARDLGLINQRQYRYLFQQMARLGYKMREPNSIPVEQITLFRGLIDAHLNELDYEISELAQLMAIDTDELRQEYSRLSGRRGLYVIEAPHPNNTPLEHQNKEAAPN